MLNDVRATRLPNGIRVITSTLPYVESVSLGIWAAVGGRYETERLCGISHFIEHLLFKGTRRRSAKQISEAIEGRGGYLNAFTQEESTCYYARIASTQLWKAFDVLADMYLNARFAAADIHRERGVIVEELMMYRDQPHHAVQEDLRGLLWPDHPLGRNLGGRPETVSGMKRGDIVAYKTRKYVPGNTIFAFAGKVRHEECVSRVDALFGDRPRQPLPRYSRMTGATKQAALRVSSREIEQTHLALGCRLFGRHDSRRYALKILSAVLGENMSSRLFQAVREKHGLAYAIHTGIHLFDETGAFFVSAGLDRSKVEKAVELIVRELDRIRQRPVGRQELKRAKDYVTGQLRLGLESTSTQMIWAGENLVSYKRFVPPEQVIEAVNCVQSEDLLRLARTVFRRNRFSLALITPEKARVPSRVLRKALAALG